MKEVAVLTCSSGFRSPALISLHLAARFIGIELTKTGSSEETGISKHSFSVGFEQFGFFSPSQVIVMSWAKNWPKTEARFVRSGDSGDYCHGKSWCSLWGNNFLLMFLAFGRGILALFGIWRNAKKQNQLKCSNAIILFLWTYNKIMIQQSSYAYNKQESKISLML